MLIPIYVAENSPNLRFVRDAANIANFAQSHLFYEIRIQTENFFSLIVNKNQRLPYQKAIDLVNKSQGSSIYVTDWRFDNNFFLIPARITRSLLHQIGHSFMRLLR
jgi:hypothetical protein